MPVLRSTDRGELESQLESLDSFKRRGILLINSSFEFRSRLLCSVGASTPRKTSDPSIQEVFRAGKPPEGNLRESDALRGK